jgi:STE24 endopeptidase
MPMDVETRRLDRPDPQRQAQARRYARLRRRLFAISLGLGLAWALGLLFSGGAVELRRALSDLNSNRLLVVALFSGIVGAGYTLLDLPLSYYSFVLSQRFGLSTQSLRDWVRDRLKVGLIDGALGLLMVQVLYLTLSVWPATWWLPLGVVYLLFSVVLLALSPLLIMPLFNKFVPLQNEHRELAERLTALAAQAGTRVQGVYRFDMSRRTRAANAALMGLGRSRRIVLGDTLLDQFTPDEIETILAHELAHQVHHDLPLGIVVQSVITLAGLWLASLGLEWGVGRFGLNGVDDVAGLPWLMLVLGTFGLLTAPLTNAWSRWRERLADRYAVRATGKPLAFASALVRLADQNLNEVEPPRWLAFWLSGHPPLGERIAAAKSQGVFTASKQT